MAKRELSREQVQLFAVRGSEKRPSFLPWQELENSPAEQARAVRSEVTGPHTDVQERAERLIECLNTIAHANMLGGFDVAVNHDEYKGPIEERYEAQTPLVANLSRDKVKRLEEEAFDNFWHATGFLSMKGSGVKSGYVRTRTLKMWGDFNGKYGEPVKNSPELVKYRKNLKKFLPADHPMRQKKRKKGVESHELAA